MDELEKEMKLSFIDEARQLLEAAEQCFLDLETRKGDPEIIETIFRLAHNMKGTSRAVGFGEVAEFTHELENLLLKLKERTLSVDDETVNLLLECNDHLKMMVDALGLDLDARFDSRDLIQKITIKLSGGSIGQEQASEFDAHADASLPPPEAFHEDVVPGAEPAPHASYEHSAHAAPAAQPAVTKKSGPPAAGPDESIRVSLSRLEKLSDFIGELVIMQTVLNQHRGEIQSQFLQRTIAQLGKLSKEIQDISMSLRMIPLKQTFAKLQRIVRDTSKTLGKEVDLVLDGETTEVDKTVLEHLADPLVHIVRNAIDHGLEMPDERKAAGKPEAGRVEIRAFHQGNNLIIEIRDDGKGIDSQRLVRKAIEKGILKPDTTMNDTEAMNLLFLPGYSTKDQVSEISGRGVGLDVVKTNVEKLSGQIQLESELGHGSCFRVILPLTLAIVDAMIVKMGEERYAVPVANVHETVQPRKEDVHFVTGRGEMLALRDKVIPLFRLSGLLKIGAKPKDREAHESIAIIVNSRKEPFAILVDDIIRQQQIVIKKLGPEVRVQKGLTGSAILGDGKPALILDLNDLAEKSAAPAAGAPSSHTHGQAA